MSVESSLRVLPQCHGAARRVQKPQVVADARRDIRAVRDVASRQGNWRICSRGATGFGARATGR